ncbi:MAG: hypothetical protein K0R75_4026, partial [Paenibacillaceae bacterium]|nr:hypothetical protein [Paenibacillaceae bacterium]
IGDWAFIHDVPKDASEPNAWRGKRSEEEIERANPTLYRPNIRREFKHSVCETLSP